MKLNHPVDDFNLARYASGGALIGLGAFTALAGSRAQH